MERYDLSYLDELEAESIHILREVAAWFERPVLLYSAGKDSSVLIRLTEKAFAPAGLPFPLLHVDTGYKFAELYAFRDKTVRETGARLVVHRNEDAIASGAHPDRLGVGGDFNYSSDENTEPPPLLLRDNYDSRSARVDLAFARVEPVRWLRIEGGRFEMPVRLTEMIWDRDLRPQGAALTLAHRDAAGVDRFNDHQAARDR